MSTTATDIFADVDRMDAAGFASHLAEDCVLRFGNAEELQGRDAIEAAIAQFFTTFKGLRHEVVKSWEIDGATILRLLVTYTRHDDREVEVPVVTIYERGDGLIEDYRVYADLAPLYA